MNLTARDTQILYAVGVLAPVRAEEIGQLLFPTSSEAERARRSTVRARLLKLAKTGHLTILRPPLVSEANRYALTAKGRALVVDASGADKGELKVMTVIGRTNLVHHDMITMARVALVLACREHPHVLLHAFHTERELRREARTAASRVIPDAIAVLAHKGDGSTVSWAIEADTGTERHAVWRMKLRAYLTLRAAGALRGHDRWGVAVIVPGEKRAQTILRVARGESCERFVIVATADEVREYGALGRAWRLASGTRTSLASPLVGEDTEPHSVPREARTNEASEE